MRLRCKTELVNRTDLNVEGWLIGFVGDGDGDANGVIQLDDGKLKQFWIDNIRILPTPPLKESSDE